MAEFCEEYFNWVEETIETPVEKQVEKIVEQCKDYPWYDPRGWVCWLVSVFVWVVEIVITVIGKWVPYLVCYVVTPILNAFGFLLRIILSIPIIGRLIGQLFKLISEFVSIILSIPDMFMRLAGVEVTKRIHVCMIVLNDDAGRAVATQPQLASTIQMAQTIYRNRASIDLVIDDIHFFKEGVKNERNDAHTDAGAYWEELWLNGSYYDMLADHKCFDSAFRRVIGLGAPIVAIVVDKIEDANGVSLGPLTNYITLAGNYPAVDPSALAHEIGHACLLRHEKERSNLMFESASRMNVDPARSDLDLTSWQVTKLRASRHVTLF